MTLTRIRFLPVAAALCGLLVVPVASAQAPGDSSAPQATASASLNKQLKKLKKRVNQLEQRLQAVSGQPGPTGQPGQQGIQGPQGTQGPAGAAPACAGNGFGDIMVAAGSVCIDRYEVSVWSSPTGGTQYGDSSDDYPCNDNGQDCTNIYARSVAGVNPSRRITYFQAQQALANVGKRLPTNAEWQQAVAGTPDSSACAVNTGGAAPALTGANAGCVSNFGANDMVGNVSEWVGDWDEERAFSCANWPAGFGDDLTCIGRGSDAASTHFPGALIRGGEFTSPGSSAGPFRIVAEQPSSIFTATGFRGVR